jgi:septum formation protein
MAHPLLGPSGDHASLILASASPRRLSLLAQIGIVPDAVLASEIDESPLPREKPRAHAIRLAHEKAEAARKLRQDQSPAYLLAADTVVGVGARILPKAETEAQARACLALLTGRGHRVFTAICLITPEGAHKSRCVETRVAFKPLSQAETEAYIASGEWRGKAGGYAIQGLAAAFVTKLVGSFSSVVGLPLAETANLLAGSGYQVIQRWPAAQSSSS